MASADENHGPEEMEVGWKFDESFLKSLINSYCKRFFERQTPAKELARRKKPKQLSWSHKINWKDFFFLDQNASIIYENFEIVSTNLMKAIPL